MELSDLDLNQLVVFHELMTQRRVSRAAERLGVTQPAVSNTLARLRRLFDDELFVRTPSGMVPTPFALRLAEPIGEALGLIHGGLNPHRPFEAATARGTMTIGMTDIGEIVFLPALVERLRTEAPGLGLRTVRNAATDLRDDMEAGRVDLAIGPLPHLKAGFFQRRLFTQRYVCLFRRGHPLEAAAWTRAAFGAAEHLRVVAAGTGHDQADELMQRAGIDRTVRLTVPHFVGVGHILQRSDLVATVTERLAESLAAPFGLVVRPHPADLPEIAITLFWHARVHRSPSHQWLRGLVVELFGRGDGGAAGTQAGHAGIGSDAEPDRAGS